ncbi:MAG TPA: hypothetical protein VK563_24055, partial [Puia sp.]|nr:hypothetical protein [Puia sp.]
MTTHSSSVKGGEKPHKVSGIVRNLHQQPMHKATVRAYSKGLRSLHLLGEAVTDPSGAYTIGYSPKEPTGTDLILKVYDNHKSLLRETAPYFNVPAAFKADIDLGDKPYAGLSEMELTMDSVTPFIGEHPLAQLTETDKDQDISFLIQKTALPKDLVENLAMAARFETFSSIPAPIWYGILRSNPHGNGMTGLITEPGKKDFETTLTALFDTLMHTPEDTLMNALQKAINQNIIPLSTSTELKKVREQLQEQVQDYARRHPVSGEASALYQKSQLGGLKGKELHAFLQAHNTHKGADADFWKELKKHPVLKSNKNLEQVQAVFHLSRLTGHDLPLTGRLIRAEKIKSPADIKRLAKYDLKDWEAAATPATSAGARSKAHAKKPKSQAVQLEKAFAHEFPTAVFAARLEKDTKSKLPHRDKISKFLQKNEHFDLVHSRVGQFIKENKGAVPEKDAAEVSGHLRRIQRIFKLIPDYDATHLLLNDNIHSAHQVYTMGQDNFVAKYADKIGEQEAAQVFNKASATHAHTIALAGNLRSMAEASSLKAFPDFSKALTAQLSHEIPNLDTLFGHTDYCACDECNSVYGAPAYLTDILHFLDQRLSSLPAAGGRTPSVKDMLLRRRPDIADIDLGCDNTNTEVPYIDIACELMEDYIAAPAITVAAATFLPSMVKGTINAALLAAVKAQFIATGQTNTGNALTAAARVSTQYSVNHLQADNTFLLQNHWVIRDSQVTLRASITPGAATIEFRLLHQTLLAADAVSAGPEYVNANAYNLLKAAKSPFSLPFDLFGAEGELYLEKLGVKKPALINIFRKEDKLAPGASPTDILSAYATLGINEAEQTLIFVADPTHQSLYWGASAASATVQVNVFEQLANLNYQQIANLVQLQFINSTKDTVIEHDDLSSDTTKARITNLTPAKFDNIHRFLRLWRKTTLTMDELDSIIMAPLLGNRVLTAKTALQLQQFMLLQQRLDLTAFELLAFYQNLDITHNLPDCLYNQLFQNPSVTNPVNPDFSIVAATPGTLGISELDKSTIAAVLRISVDDVNALIPKTINRISFPPLSFMFRYAKLAQGLQLSMSDLLNLTNLIDANPFQDLNSTCLFIQKYRLLQSSGLSIDDLNYVLRHQDNSTHTLVPSISQITTSLAQLQTDLLTVRSATQATADPNGVLLNKWLSDPLFGWDNGMLAKLADILSTVDDGDFQKKIDNNGNFLLNLRMVFHDVSVTADLSALPLTQTSPAVPIVFPDSISAQLSFDADRKLLRLSGYMSPADLTALQTLSSDAGYLAALSALFAAAQKTDSS